MGLFSKLKFWKKEDELDFETLAEKEMGKKPSPDFGPEQNTGLEEKSLFPEEPEPAAPPFQSRMSGSAFASPSPANRDLELINSKLDTLKAMLGSLDQRIAHLEQNSALEKKQRLW